METFVKFITALIVSVLGMLVLDLFLAAILQWLWNDTLTITQVPITYWEAFRLLFIVGILFVGANVKAETK